MNMQYALSLSLSLALALALALATYNHIVQSFNNKQQAS
jgi:hypothetical protein